MRSGIILYAEWISGQGAGLLEQLLNELEHPLTDILGGAVLAQVVHHA